MNKLFGGLGGIVGSACTVQLEFKRADGQAVKTVTVKSRKDEQETLPLYTNKDSVQGEVKVTPIPGKKVDHQGIRVQLLGEIELAAERGHPHEFVSLGGSVAVAERSHPHEFVSLGGSVAVAERSHPHEFVSLGGSVAVAERSHPHEFVSLVRDLSPPGELLTQQTLPFEFNNVEMQYDSYRGLQARLRYLLRVTVTRGLGQSVVRDFPFWVRNYEQPPEQGPPIKMEVGIEDCLHIEFEYNKGSYQLKDTVVGKIYFLLVRIKLKHMELEIRRRETTGAGAGAKNESETIAKYEIMDGAPARGEVIPIRLFLSPYELSPSYKNVHNKFSVRYFLNLVLVDEEDRRYFKQQEITLYRLDERDQPEDGLRKPLLSAGNSSLFSPPATTSGPAGPGSSSAAGGGTSDAGSVQPAGRAAAATPAVEPAALPAAEPSEAAPLLSSTEPLAAT
ncbi:hypothetical protein N2152v2_000633 [Parachlorella kessleri]